MRLRGPASLLIVVLFTGCGDGATSGAGPSGPAGDLLVVATTSILGDVAAQITGDDAHVEVLVPIGADPHDYQASARQAARLLEADLVVANGLALEAGLIDVLDAVRADGANVLEVGPRVNPISRRSPALGDDADADGTEHDGHGGDDPHFWLDPVRVGEAGQLIADELAALAPAVDWAARAAAYAAELRSLDEGIRAILAAVPDGARKLVSNHESLGYFAARYDFEVVGAIVPGGATLADPSSAQLAALVAVLQREGVPAVFAETTEPRALAEAIAAETGGTAEVVELYTGSLGEPGSGAETLAGMLRTNAQRVADALG